MDGKPQARILDRFEPSGRVPLIKDVLDSTWVDPPGDDADELFWSRSLTPWDFSFQSLPTTWSSGRQLSNGIELKCTVQGRYYAYKGKRVLRPVSWTARLRWCQVTVTLAVGKCKSLLDAARQILSLPIDHTKLGKAFYQKSNAVCVYKRGPETQWSRLSLQGTYEPFATWFGDWFEHVPFGDYRVVFQSGSQTNLHVGSGHRSSGSTRDEYECPNWMEGE